MRLWMVLALCGVVSAQTGGSLLSSESEVQAVAFTKDGTAIAGKCADNQLRFWDARTGVLRKTVALGKDERLTSVHPGSGIMAVTLADGGLELRDMESGKISQRFATVSRASRRLALGPEAGATTPEGMLLARSTRVPGNARDEIMRLADASGKERFAVPAGIGGPSAMAISPDGKFLAAGSYDTDVRIWNAKNGELVRRIDELLVAMFAMDFTPDGKFLVTGGVDRTLYLWDTNTWKLAQKLNGQAEMISAIAIAPGGKRIATGGYSEVTQEHPVKVLVWDTDRNVVLKSFDAPRMVGSVAFSPDGRMLAAACGKKAIQIWNVAD